MFVAKKLKRKVQEKANNTTKNDIFVSKNTENFYR